MFSLTTHSTHFIYGYMASNILVNDYSDSDREETRCRHYMGYSSLSGPLPYKQRHINVNKVS